MEVSPLKKLNHFQFSFFKTVRKDVFKAIKRYFQYDEPFDEFLSLYFLEYKAFKRMPQKVDFENDEWSFYEQKENQIINLQSLKYQFLDKKKKRYFNIDIDPKYLANF